jgi:hypothetical protein
MMGDDWVSVFSTTEMSEIVYLQEILSEENIESVVMSKQDSIYLFGEIELYTRNADAMAARFIIEKQKSE